MPYFVYHITIDPESGVKHLEHLDTFDDYRSARALAREHRACLPPGGDRDCRLIFAKTEVEAERLLSTPRDERVIGED